MSSGKVFGSAAYFKLCDKGGSHGVIVSACGLRKTCQLWSQDKCLEVIEIAKREGWIVEDEFPHLLEAIRESGLPVKESDLPQSEQDLIKIYYEKVRKEGYNAEDKKESCYKYH